MDANRPPARFTVITLGVSDVGASARFYEALGFVRKMRATGDAVAFFETGGTALALYPWDQLAGEAAVPDQPRPQAFRGVTLAWNCMSEAEVDRAMALALAAGGRLVKQAQSTSYGGYAGYFVDPDDHLWEIVVAPGISVMESGLLALPD
jgi:predicted lactoylglutathione lyase